MSKINALHGPKAESKRLKAVFARSAPYDKTMESLGSDRPNSLAPKQALRPITHCFSVMLPENQKSAEIQTPGKRPNPEVSTPWRFLFLSDATAGVGGRRRAHHNLFHPVWGDRLFVNSIGHLNSRMATCEFKWPLEFTDGRPGEGQYGEKDRNIRGTRGCGTHPTSLFVNSRSHLNSNARSRFAPGATQA